MEEDIGKKHILEFLREYESDKSVRFEERRLRLVIKLCIGKTDRAKFYRRAMSVAKNKLKEMGLK